MTLRAFWTFALFLAGGSLVHADPPTSGPAVGKSVGGFQVTPITGTKKTDLFAKAGDQPTVLIFARAVNEPTIALVRKLAAATEKHKDAKLSSIVVLLSDAAEIDPKLKQLADEKLPGTQVAVSADKAAGPKAYNLNAEAEVTIVMTHKRVVKAVRAYRAGELKDAEPVVAEANRVARAVFAPNIGDPVVAYMPKKALGVYGARKCETC